MNDMTETSYTAVAPMHMLRCTGRKALRFQGWQLVEAIGQSTGRAVWHDLNIYNTLAGKIVTEILVRSDAGERPDISHVKIFDTLDDASEWLEAYDPADDLPIPDGLGARESPLPWTILEAVKLRMRMDNVELDYKSLLSDVFTALDLSERAEHRAEIESEKNDVVDVA